MSISQIEQPLEGTEDKLTIVDSSEQTVEERAQMPGGVFKPTMKL